MLSDTVTEEPNEIFSLAEEFIHHTSRCLFLTGKAGTGKTTFLKKIKTTTRKNTIVVAPTGVAAIHAGGTTLHSFFQLPFSPYVPSVNVSSAEGDLSDRITLLKNLRIEGEKRSLFREMELLIIDEISMVRADVLDAVDTILRYFRKKAHLPFGGVQVLFIGDLFQLPPVVPDADWTILRNYYKSPFFFDAHVMQAFPPVYLELDTIYRQRDPVFIEALNRIRNNELGTADLAFLNERYSPGFKPETNDGYITLTTHNYKADKINAAELANLTADLHRFEGIVEGEFSERSFPTDKLLLLKKGAQVMFVKNDMERVRRYYNGKIGLVKRIEAGKIVVAFPKEGIEVDVEKDTWRNIKYTFNASTRQVEEDELGTFTQYPLRLAWAVTIHKSQGLTFDKVIIDAENSFAPGQVYVALSRCTSLQGIVLCSKIRPSSVKTDERVVRFAEQAKPVAELKPVLHYERKQHVLSTVLAIFDFALAIEEVRRFNDVIEQKKKNLDKPEALALVTLILKRLTDQQAVALKFQHQLRDIAAQQDENLLSNRIEAGVAYFSDFFSTEIMAPLQVYETSLKNRSKVKQYRKKLCELIEFLSSFSALFNKAVVLAG